MIGLHPDCPADISLLADHLDTALAVGEEMLAATLPARSDLDEADPESAPIAIDLFVRRLMQLEGSFLLRVLRARRLATEIGRADAALKAAGDLFRAQTAVLHEMILSAGENAEGQLTRAGDSHAYLRSRGLIAPEAAAPSPFESVTVGESFRIGGVAEVGQMLDLVSALLDLLDARYGLYSPDIEDALQDAEAAPIDDTDAEGEARLSAPSASTSEAGKPGAPDAKTLADGGAGETTSAVSPHQAGEPA
jgi:hypothetical protein